MVPFKFLIIILISCFFVNNIALAKCKIPDTDWLHELLELEEKYQIKPKDLTSYLKELENLLNQYEQINDEKDSIYVRLVNRLGDWYCKNGDYERGLTLLNDALALCKESHDPSVDASFAAVLYFNLGFVKERLNFFEDFYSFMDSCISTATRYPNRLINGINAYEKLSIHHLERGDHHRSLEILDQGLLFTGERNSNGHVSLLYLQKAQVLLESNLIVEAEENLEMAMASISGSVDKERYLRIAYLVLAYLAEKKNNFDDAILYYKKSHDLNYKLGFYMDSYKSLNNMGIVYALDLNKPDESLHCFQRCIEILKIIEEKQKLPVIYNNMGYLYLGQENIMEAINSFQEGLNELTKGLSGLDWNKNPPRNALKMVDNDKILYLLLKNKAASLLEFHKVDPDMGYLKAAMETFKLADYSINLMRWNHRHNQSKLYWRKESKEMYELAIETSYQLQDPESALYFFEKSRAVLLNDRLSELGAQQFLGKEDGEKEQALKMEMVSLENKMSGIPPSSPFFQKLANEKFQLQEAYEKFIKSLEVKYPNYYQYKYDTMVVSLKEMTKSVIGPGQSYLGYFEGRDFLYALTIGTDTAAVYKMPIGELSSMVEELLFLASSRGNLNQNYPRYMELAHQIYASIFEPLGIKNKRILISPDDVFIPFDLLIKDKNDANSFLVYDHAFSYTYSAGYILKTEEKSKRLNHSLLGFAPVNYQPHLQQTSLLGSDISMKNVKELFSNSEFSFNEMATKRAFLNQLPQHSIVHVYSHAEADPLGNEHKIYFSDSILLVSELQALGKLPTRLILLTACNTGVGKVFQGEGIFSMARAFASSGVPASISTLWAIEDQSIYQITELFYQFLKDGLPLDVAQQQAKLAFLQRNEASLSLPYYWAGSVLIGNSKSFFKEKSDIAIYASLILFFLILASSFYFLRKRLN